MDVAEISSRAMEDGPPTLSLTPVFLYPHFIHGMALFSTIPPFYFSTLKRHKQIFSEIERGLLGTGAAWNLLLSSLHL